MALVDNVLKHISLHLGISQMYRSGAVTNSHVELVREVPISVDVSEGNSGLIRDYFLLTSIPVKYLEISLHPVEFGFEIC